MATDGVLSQPSRRTLAKHRVYADAQMLVRFDQGDTGPVDSDIEQALSARLAGLWPQCDAVVVSDYGYGILTPRVVRALADLQARWSPVLVADSRRLETFRGIGPTAVKPNYVEAAALLGGLVETLGYDVHFGRPPESADDTIRRVRPRICLVDCTDPVSCRGEFFGRATMRGVSVVIFGTPQALDRVRAVALAHNIEMVLMPPELNELEATLQRAGS